MSADGRGEMIGADDDLRISERVQQIVARRVAIEQAKGMLMFICGIDGDAAFDVLRRQSQHHNVKLALLAELVVLDLSKAEPRPGRVRSPDFLLTVFQRIADVAARQAAIQAAVGS